MRRRSVGLVLLASLALAGCFAYVPVELDAVSVNDRVRARLSADGEEAVAAALGEPRTVLSGRVIAAGPDTLLLGVPLASARGTAAAGLPSGAPSLPVPIPAASIRELEVRELLRARTTVLVMGTAALMGYILYRAFERTDPRGAGGENPPPVDQGLRLHVP